MISIIVPNYNGRTLLEHNLPPLLEACHHYTRSTHQQTELILVDDASSDTSVEFLNKFTDNYSQSNICNIVILTHSLNKGFSEAMNTGISKAQYPILVSLNSDVTVTKEFLLPLEAHFASPEVFSVKCHSILPDGTVESRKKVTLHRGLVQTEIDSTPSNIPIDLFYSDAGSCAYDREKMTALGGFDVLYSPFYFEDCDLGYRALKRGWKNIYEPTSVVYHEKNQTVKKVVKRLDQNPIFIRNRELFNTKNIYEPSLRKKARATYWIRLIKALLTLNLPMTKGLLMALRDTSRALTSHTKDRDYETKSDIEVLSSFVDISS